MISGVAQDGSEGVAIGETSFPYEQEVQPRSKLGRWKAEHVDD